MIKIPTFGYVSGKAVQKGGRESWQVLGNRPSGINTGSQVVGTGSTLPPPPPVAATKFMLFTSKRGQVKTIDLGKPAIHIHWVIVHLTANVLHRVGIVINNFEEQILEWFFLFTASVRQIVIRTFES